MKRKKSSKVAYRNKSPTGWWWFCEIEYWVSNEQKELTPRSRCTVWENTRIIKAKNREEAFKKATRLAQRGHPIKTGQGEWRNGGVSQLLPIYEEFEDGAEIIWDKRGSLTMQRIKRMAKTKSQLLVFNDDENE